MKGKLEAKLSRFVKSLRRATFGDRESGSKVGQSHLFV